MHAKALDAGADEVVFDLEDAVAADAKATAREQVARTLASPEWARRRVAVRVNPSGSAEQDADLSMCAALGLEELTIVVPKVESPADVEAAARVAPVQALIETPRGLAAASSIASEDAVETLILGYADLAAALGRRGAEHDLDRWLVAQEALLAGARIGGAQAIDGPFFGLRDERGVSDAARAARELGFDGKWAIHPAQVAAINDAFSPSPRERRWAAAVTAAVGDAAAAGRSGRDRGRGDGRRGDAPAGRAGARPAVRGGARPTTRSRRRIASPRRTTTSSPAGTSSRRPGSR